MSLNSWNMPKSESVVKDSVGSSSAEQSDNKNLYAASKKIEGMSSSSTDMPKPESDVKDLVGSPSAVRVASSHHSIAVDAYKKDERKGTLKETCQPKHRSCIKVDCLRNSRAYERNPITGDGLSGDGVGGLRPITTKKRSGNPLTGEGYKPGQQDFIGPINMTDAHETINMNTNKDGRIHIPPGGYSSGIW